jgi:biopolymer transport protein ExbB
MSRVVPFLFFLLIGLLSGATPSLAWWNADWSSRMKITADAGPKGANVTAPIGRTQVLIRLHSGNFNFDTAKEKGEDLRLIAGDDRTPLHFHIERFDGLLDQIGLIWVDVPDLAPGTATVFYLYWGNKNAQPGGDPHATYDPDQVLVYHFEDDNGLPHDETGYGNNALTAGKRDDGGMIGHGLRLNGTDPVRLPASPSLAIPAGQGMTFSVWVRPNDGTNTGVIYSQRDGSNAVTIGLDQGVAYAEIEAPDGKVRTSAGAPVAEGYHLITMTTGGKTTIYVDGEPRGEAAATLPALNAVSLLGSASAAPPSDATPSPSGQTPPIAASGTAPPAGFTGVIDEFRISKAVRQPGSFQIAVAGEGPKPSLLTFDPPEQSSLLGNSYFGIIVRSVTNDAWVVIGILGVMMLSSWVVMIGKALYFRRIAAANRLFRTKFRESLRHPVHTPGQYGALGPGGEDRLRHSPLWRLYEISMSEVRERIEIGRLDADGRLPSQSLTAIRAALDAGLAREQERLNRLMVLLTISISGGPFLGLLGTVVGVMITFAAIAAAGDVNINAIAPGISAALLATVAGLAVAIPALFGYNYFTIRIRDADTGMRVFVDELIARVGEGTDLGRPVARPRVAVHSDG